LKQTPIILALALSGCGDQAIVQPCTSMVMGPLIAEAEVLELDDYGATADCVGDQATPGAQPITTQRFPAGTPISVTLAPGPHTVVLLAWADAAATQLIGSGCVEQSFAAGSQICIDLTLTEVDATATDDLSADDFGIPDLSVVQPDLMPPPCPNSAMMCLADGGEVCCAAVNATCSVSCGLSCNAGHLDCNQAGSDGCECSGTTCCGAACQTTHTDGYGDDFFDCVAFGTHDQAQATKAAMAYDPNGSFHNGLSTCTYSDSKGSANSVCWVSTAKGTCVNFIFSATGNYVQYIGTSLRNSKTTSCPFGITPSTYPAWN
jgi:hypothetical protein